MSLRRRGVWGAALALLLLVLFAALFTARDDSEQQPETVIGRIAHALRSGFRTAWHGGDSNSTKKAKANAKGQKALSEKPADGTQAFTIVVTNAAGSAVADAQVTLRPNLKGSTPLQLLTTQAGIAAGTAPYGKYDLLVTHSQFAPFSQQVTLSSTSRLKLTVKLVAGVNIKGRVVDQEGRPVADVAINARKRRIEHLATGAVTYLNDAAYAPRQTDDDGRFSLSNVAVGANSLEFQKEGYAAVTRTIDIPSSGLKEDLNIVLARPAAISGQVLDEDQHPVSTATITVLGYRISGEELAQTSPTISTSTSTTGSFTLRRLLADATYDIRVDHSSYATLIQTRIPANTEGLALVLNRGGLISGRTLFIDRPTTTARVVLQANTVIDGTSYTRDLTTNADGTWQYDHLPFGNYKLSVNFEGIVNEPRVPVSCAKDKPTTNVLVEVYQAIPVEGTAVDVATDLPVPNATITASATYGYDKVRARTFAAQCDERGQFRLPVLPAGTHSIIGKATGYLASNAGGANLNLSLQLGDNPEPLIVPMSQGGTVEGYCRTKDGDAIPAAEVQLFAASTTLSNFSVKDLHTVTDGTGRFVFRGFPLAERLQLYASGRKEGFAKSRSTVMNLSAKQPHGAANIVMTAGTAVTGRVMDTAGRPLTGAKVTFESREFPGDPSPSTFNTQAGTDGTYLLEHCTPGISRISAARQDFVTQVKTPTLKPDSIVTKYDFKLLSANRIAGTVTDFHDRPIAGAKVNAIPLEKATGYGNSTTDKKGAFDIRNLSPGFFRLEATFPLQTPDGQQQYTFIVPRVQCGSASVLIDCDVEPSVDADIEGDDGKRINAFKLSLRSRLDINPPQEFRFTLERSVTSAHGSLRVLQIPRGLYTMEIKAEGYETYRDENVVVGPGNRTTLPTIRLRSGSGLTGRIISGTTGRAVSNVVVRVLDTAKAEVVTVNRIQLSSYSRQDVLEWLDAYYDTNSDLDPNYMYRPVARVRANVFSTTKSDFSGRFSVTNLPTGQFTVEFEHPDYSLLRMDNISVSRTKATELGDVSLYPGGEVSGQVVDSKGTPIYNATVLVRGEKGTRSTTRTDFGGNYIFRGLRPGERTIVVRATVGTRAVYAYGFADVHEDQTTELDFVLDVTANVQGAIATPDTPARTGTVRLYALDENNSVLTDIHYDGTARGPNFTINAIPPAPYAAVVTGTGAAGTFTFWQMIQVQKGDNSISLQTGAASISGTVFNSAGTAAAGAKLQLRPDTATTPLPVSVYNLLVRNATISSNGKYAFNYLPAGNYQLVYTTPANPTPTLLTQIGFAPGQRVTNYRITVP